MAPLGKTVETISLYSLLSVPHISAVLFLLADKNIHKFPSGQLYLYVQSDGYRTQHPKKKKENSFYKLDK